MGHEAGRVRADPNGRKYLRDAYEVLAAVSTASEADDVTEANMNTHRVNRAHGWPIEQPDHGYPQKRYELGEEFDAAAGTEVPASDDGKNQASVVPFFTAEEIAAGVKSGYLVDLAEEEAR